MRTLSISFNRDTGDQQVGAFPAVAVSAYASLDDRARALAVGFTAHFAKPIDPAARVRALAAAHSPAE